MRDLIKPIIKQVFEGDMSHETSINQGTALIDFYANTESYASLTLDRQKESICSLFCSMF